MRTPLLVVVAALVFLAAACVGIYAIAALGVLG